MIFFDKRFGIFRSSLLQGVNAGFGTKKSGNGFVRKEIFNFFKDADIQYKHLAIPNQIHSDNIQLFNGENFIENPKADGLIAKRPGIVMTVKTADCVPILYYSKKENIAGISHQGWRGLQAELPKKMIRELGSGIRAAIGPAINDCCYDIGFEIYEDMKKKFSDSIFRKENGKVFLNLTKLSFLQLRDSGVADENIDHFPFCTSCDQRRFYSYRRMKKSRNFPRQFSFILI